MEWFDVLSPMAAVLTAVVGWYLAESIRGKNKADAANSITDAATKLISELQEELTTMRGERTNLRLYSMYLLAGITKLTGQLKETPIFSPLSYDEFVKQNIPPEK